MSVTIREISSMSGFSVSTVSKALNDKKDISVETRKAIKGIAKKFNYVPNNYAVALRGKKTKSIAVILPSVTVPHYNQALFHLQKAAESSDYRVLLYQTFSSFERETNYINRLNDGCIDGIFVISETTQKKSECNLNNFPLIALNVNKNHSIRDIERLTQSCLSKFIKLKTVN